METSALSRMSVIASCSLLFLITLYSNLVSLQSKMFPISEITCKLTVVKHLTVIYLTLWRVFTVDAFGTVFWKVKRKQQWIITLWTTTALYYIAELMMGSLKDTETCFIFSLGFSVGSSGGSSVKFIIQNQGHSGCAHLLYTVYVLVVDTCIEAGLFLTLQQQAFF